MIPMLRSGILKTITTSGKSEKSTQSLSKRRGSSLNPSKKKKFSFKRSISTKTYSKLKKESATNKFQKLLRQRRPATKLLRSKIKVFNLMPPECTSQDSNLLKTLFSSERSFAKMYPQEGLQSSVLFKSCLVENTQRKLKSYKF